MVVDVGGTEDDDILSLVELVGWVLGSWVVDVGTPEDENVISIVELVEEGAMVEVFVGQIN